MSKESSVAALVSEGLAEVDSRYGRFGLMPKLYHGLEHTVEVMESGLAIARLALQRGKITLEDMPLIELAACYHDIFREAEPGEAERISASILADKMKRTGEFSKEAVIKAGSFIIGTTVNIVGNRIIQQGGEDYPSKILADADLSALGKPFEIFEPIMLRFYRESRDDPEAEPDKEFLEGEVELLKTHEFFTDEAKELFPHQAANAVRLSELIAT